MKKFLRYWLLNQIPLSAILIYFLLPHTGYWIAWIIGNNLWIIFSYLICEKKVFKKENSNWQDNIVKK